MAKISIIVPVYNVEQYLEKSLDSIVNQSMSDIEIIVVDDGSPDNSSSIYERYAKNDARIIIVKKENAGVSEARNTGLEYATGEFVMFADSDDWMEINACEDLYKEQIRTNADLVIADVKVITNIKEQYVQVFGKEFYTEDQEFIRQYQKTCIGYSFNPLPSGKWKNPGMGSPWNKLFKREIIVNNGLRFDPYVMGIYDDNLFTLHYMNYAKSMAYIQKPVYDFRLVSGSLTQSYKPNTLLINSRIFERIQNFIAETEEADFFEEAFYIYVIRRLSKSINVYFFADNNPKPLKDKFREYKDVISLEPYKTAIKKTKLSNLLNNHKVVVVLSRLRAPKLIWMILKIKRVISKISG